MSPTIVIVIGRMAPAPIPWMARNAMRLGMSHAKEARIDPRRKSPMPNRIIGLRPSVSASFA